MAVVTEVTFSTLETTMVWLAVTAAAVGLVAYLAEAARDCGLIAALIALFVVDIRLGTILLIGGTLAGYLWFLTVAIAS